MFKVCPQTFFLCFLAIDLVTGPLQSVSSFSLWFLALLTLFLSCDFIPESVYTTTAGSPYIYRNCMVYTVGMGPGGNDMRRPRPCTESMSSLCILY